MASPASGSGAPTALIVVILVLIGGCCIGSAGLAVLAPAVTGRMEREGFVYGFRAGMELPEADEIRLADIAYDEARATNGLRDYGGRDATALMLDGAHRADGATIVSLHSVRLLLARASPALCAGSWTGGLPSDEVHRALATQPDEVIHRFFRASFQLIVASLDARPMVMSPEVVLTQNDDLWVRASQAYAPSRISEAVTAGNAVSPDVACSAMLEIYGYVDGEAEPLRTDDARALFISMNTTE